MIAVPKHQDTLPRVLQSGTLSSSAAAERGVGSSTGESTQALRPQGNRPVLFVLTGPQLGAVFSLESPQVIIGRDSDADAHLTDDTVSGRHAVVTRGDDGVQIEDYGSRSGTFVNGQRLAGIRPLRDGDRVRVGTFNILKFAMMDELEQKALATMSELSLQDHLTRLYNRRYFDKRLRSELSFAARHGTQMAVLMIDVDLFKDINDTHGHRMGDLVLKLVARTIERLMRPEDVLARVGGDEFIVITRATSLRNVEILGQRICQRIAAARVPGHGSALRILVSVGGALLDTDTAVASAKVLIASADRAMYRAKAAGGNRVVVCQVAPDSTPPPLAPTPRSTRPPPA